MTYPAFEVFDTDVVVNNDVVAVRLNAVVSGENFSVTGVAKRDPADQFNLGTGTLLAYGRALDTLSRRVLRRAGGLVKHADDVRPKGKGRRV